MKQMIARRCYISVFVHFFQANGTVLADRLELFVFHFFEMAIAVVMTILFIQIFPDRPTWNAAALDEYSVARNHSFGFSSLFSLS